VCNAVRERSYMGNMSQIAVNAVARSRRAIASHRRSRNGRRQLQEP
jgi:hypothetical protein